MISFVFLEDYRLKFTWIQNRGVVFKPIYCYFTFWFQNTNKKNDNRFNNRGYSLFFLMGIFLKHLWLIPHILKWQNCKIFTNIAPSQNPSKRSHGKFSKKGYSEKFTKSLGKTPLLEPALKRDSNTSVFQWNIQNFEEHLFWRISANDYFWRY